MHHAEVTTAAGHSGMIMGRVLTISPDTPGAETSPGHTTAGFRHHDICGSRSLRALNLPMKSLTGTASRPNI